MLKSFRDRAKNASPGVVGHIQIGRIQKRHTKSGDKMMGGSTDHILLTTAAKDPNVDGAFMLDGELMRKLWGDSLPQSQFGEFGKSRRLKIFAAGDTLEETFDTDRNLHLKQVRTCYSRDGESAEWSFGADRQWMLPASMQHLKTGESGGRIQLKCLENDCPLVLDPIRIGKWLYKCKPRATLLCRIADAGAGIYDFDTTSEISGDFFIAMLGWVEQLTGGNMSAVPLELVMAESGTQHGSTVWRTSLQIACDLPEAMRLAHEWKRMKEVVGGRVVVEIKREEVDPAFTQLFNTEETIEPPALHELQEECAWAFGIIGHDVGGVLVGFGAQQHGPKAEQINEDDRQPVIDALREAVRAFQNPPQVREPEPPPAGNESRPPDHGEPSPPSGSDYHVPPPQGGAPASTGQADRGPINWDAMGPPDSQAPPEIIQQISRMQIRLPQIMEVIPDFSPHNPFTVAQCRMLIERFGA